LAEQKYLLSRKVKAPAEIRDDYRRFGVTARDCHG